MAGRAYDASSSARGVNSPVNWLSPTLVVLSIVHAGCGGGLRAATVDAADAGDVARALAAYRDHREQNGSDRGLLAVVAEALLVDAGVAGGPAEGEAAVRALSRVGAGGSQGLSRIAAQGRGVARALALAELGRRGRGCAVAALRGLVDDPHPAVRAVALSVHAPDRDHSILRAALDDISPLIRSAAAQRWGGDDTPPEVRHLLGRMARVDPSASVRIAVLGALSRIGPAAFDTVNRGIEDSNSSVRMAAVGALLRIDFERGWLALQRIFAVPSSAAGVEAARRRLTNRGVLGGMGVGDAEAYLVRALAQQGAAIRAQAAVALTSIHFGEAVGRALEAMVEREPDPAARLSLALALIRFDNTHDTALEVLMRLSLENSGMFGLQAAVALAGSGDAAALRRVRQDRRADDALIRAVAFAALARTLGRADDALEGLDDMVWRVRLRTAGAIMARAAQED